MSKTRKIFLDLVHRITATNNDIREVAADEVTDVNKSFSKNQAEAIAVILVEARLVENEIGTQEAQLNALCELKEWHGLSNECFEALKDIRASDLKGSQGEYYREILSKK